MLDQLKQLDYQQGGSRNKQYITLFILLVSICLSISGADVAGQVSIEVQPHKKELIQGEPLIITAQISNKGNEKEGVSFFGIEYYSNKINLGQIKIGERFITHGMRPPNKPTYSIGPYILDPGETKREIYYIIQS